MRLSGFKALSFDCYGTLIDWESGIVAALQPLLARAAVPPTQSDVLEQFGRYESPAQKSSPRATYPEILGRIYESLAADWGVPSDPIEKENFSLSVKNWPKFEDTTNALSYLKEHYKLVILSNIDRQTFRRTNQSLGIDFDFIYTAQDIGSYKPDSKNFMYLIDHLAEGGIAKTDVLHVAESWYHDHLPANEFGLASAWINRRHGRPGYGATHVPQKIPSFSFKFNSLSELVELHRVELAVSNQPPYIS
jgi:2-haloacid dehalogenase